MRRNENVGSIQMRADGLVWNRAGKCDQAVARIGFECIPQLRSKGSISNEKEFQLATCDLMLF